MGQIIIRPVYLIDAFCQNFGTSRSKAYAEIKAGRLKTFKIGDRTAVAGVDALAWLEARRAESASSKQAA
jgi:hypothetical protein